MQVHARTCVPFLGPCSCSARPCASLARCHLCSPARGEAGAQLPSVYSVAAELRLRVLLKRGRSRKSKRGGAGAPSSSSTVMLLGRPTRSTEPGTKRVCWGPRRGQYRPRLKPFIHSWPWKMTRELSGAPPLPPPLSWLRPALPCSNLGTSRRCPRRCRGSQRSRCRKLALLCPRRLVSAGRRGASRAAWRCLWPGGR